MKIYIELLVPLVIGLMFLGWYFWLKLSKLWHNWRYKPENDRGKKGEEHRQELLRQGLPDPIRAIAKASIDSTGQGEFEGRGDIPTTAIDEFRKDSDSIGEIVKPRRKFRNPFRRKK